MEARSGQNYLINFLLCIFNFMPFVFNSTVSCIFNFIVQVIILSGTFNFMVHLIRAILHRP